jgi:hypothetical protein
MTGRPRNTVDALWSRVRLGTADECWPWLGGTRNGYGHFTIDRKGYYAHRVALGALYCEHGREKPVMHLCNNKLCCNPAHLKLGSPAQNTRDAYRDGLARAGSRHHRTRYPAELIDRIKADPRPQTVLSAAYGVSQSHVSRIKNGTTRRHEAVNG